MDVLEAKLYKKVLKSILDNIVSMCSTHAGLCTFTKTLYWREVITLEEFLQFNLQLVAYAKTKDAAIHQEFFFLV